MNELSLETPNVGINDERRITPYLGPILLVNLEPEVVNNSDEDLDDELFNEGEFDLGPADDPVDEGGINPDGGQVEEEVVIPLEFLKLPENPGTLLFYLRAKKESFINNIHSLGESFGPLLHKY
jgi:hypothetical protein